MGMRILFSEFNNNYTTYSFGYAVYAVADLPEMEAVYDKGFLPYSADLSLKSEIFYLCRSLRVNLSRFSDSSENRRVDRKMENFEIRWELKAKKEFPLEDPVFLDLCLRYSALRFVGGGLGEDRLSYILHRENATHVLTFAMGDKVLAHVLLGLHGQSLHYWFAFLDPDWDGEAPLGKWVMWRTIVWAKEQGFNWVYLGTCYGQRSLYKVRDHKGLEFFDGEGWSDDLAELKRRCKEDGQERDRDMFKPRG
jgi:leucyl-tRNA---protein transferase